MAHVEKFTKAQIPGLLRHIERRFAHSSNPDIDFERTEENYSLLARSVSAYQAYIDRREELYIFNRADVVEAVGWVITLPREVEEKDEREFFELCHNFLIERYGGERNCIASAVHRDEGGQPHLHHVFIPVCPDVKHEEYDERICCAEVINREELRNFHPALQAYLHDAGFECNVHSGITREIGGNISVEDLKRAELLMERKVSHREGFTW